MNFARRQECNKCGAPKPGDSYGGGTFGAAASLMTSLMVSRSLSSLPLSPMMRKLLILIMMNGGEVVKKKPKYPQTIDMYMYA